MHIKQMDDLLKQVSLLFGPNQVQHLIPDNLLVDIGIFDLAHIDEANLETEPSKQAKLYIFFNYLLSYASSKLVEAEARLKRADSEAYSRIEAKFKAAGDRCTDPKIEKAIEIDEKYLEAVAQYVEFKNMTNTFSNLVKGLACRGDMVVQLVSKRKREEHNQT